MRVILPGVGPQRLHYLPESAGAAIRAVGGDPTAPNMEIAVDGRRAGTDAPVGPDSTVTLQPRARHG